MKRSFDNEEESPSPSIRGPVHQRALVIYTGGTIGMCEDIRGHGLAPKRNFFAHALKEIPIIYDAEYSTARQMHFPPVLSDGFLFVMPETKDRIRIEFEVLEYESLIDSSNATMSTWVQIARNISDNYHSFDGFVVLHGTDTMGYTSSALSFMLEHLGKPVVVTGSQVPIFEARSDARENFTGALYCATHLAIPEVTIFFRNKLYRGNRTCKIDASSYQAFHSPNLEPLAELDMSVKINWDIVFRDSTKEEFRFQDEMEPNVTLLRFYPGLTAELFANFFKPPVRGVVLQTFGAGNAPNHRKDLLEVLEKAYKDKIVIVNCTQCFKGSVSPSYATGVALKNCGVVPGGDMTPEAALTKLSYILAKPSLTFEQQRKLVRSNIRGEITELSSAAGEISLQKGAFLHKLASALHLTSDPELKALDEALMPSLLCSAAAKLDEGKSIQRLLKTLEGSRAVSCADYDRRTPLHVACSANNRPAVVHLLEKGANVHSKDMNGDTPLMCACKIGSVGIVKELVLVGAHFAQTELEKVPSQVCWAVYEDNIQMLEALAIAGATLSDLDAVHGDSGMHVAARHGKLKSLEFLMSRDVSNSQRAKRNSMGKTPVEVAFSCGQKEAEEVLKSTDINSISS